MGSTRSVPKYRHHKASGQAFVQIKGKRIYLGRHGTKESREKYAEHVANIDAGEPIYKPTAAAVASYTVSELAASYLDHAEAYYVKGGRKTTTATVVGWVLRLLAKHYGRTPVVEFGPLKLKRMQSVLVDMGLSRRTVNGRIAVIKRMVRWGVAEELVPPEVHQKLAALEGLRKGRTKAPDHQPIEPVDDHVVEGTLPLVSPIVADLIRFQRYTGCRPSEACMARPADVDRSGDIWLYIPQSHKTEHRGRHRAILIGPKAQDVLRPYLLRPEDAYCFSPREAEQKRLEARHAARETPLSYGNRPGSNRRRKSGRAPGDCYTKDSYARAVRRGIEKANAQRTAAAEEVGVQPKLLPHWRPNQLRHTAATEARRRFGLEAAQVLLGHAHADVTEHYAERDMKLGMQIALMIG